MIKTENLKIFEETIRSALDKISRENIIARIWSKDPSLWKKEGNEISNCLGWLFSPEKISRAFPKIKKFVRQVRQDGYTHALLLGMGGSILAAEVLGSVFQTSESYLDLSILDSTDPAAVLTFKESLDPEKTLFLVSSKSGRTIETTSFFKFFFNWVRETLGESEAGAHFVAITDPGTPLEEMAKRFHFRSLFPGEPDIGGRFSALSLFGLVPSALKGIEIEKLVRGGQEMSSLCRNSIPRNNPGVFLGTILAVLALASKNKATFILSPSLESFASWLEQLLAESTGKDGKGILPVTGEPVSLAETYGSDRFFIFLNLEGDKTHELALKVLKEAKFPLIVISLPDVYGLGSQFFLWQMATSIAGFSLEINPFDQPDVEASKRKTKEILPLLSEVSASAMEKNFRLFLSQAKLGDYIAIQAFLQPSPDIAEALQSLRLRLREKTRLAVTYGFGPRFLHSTGQLHKGDQGNGLFIQLETEDLQDVPIPDQPDSPHSTFSFGLLKRAQAKGDWEALREKGRRAIHFNLGKNALGGLKKLISFI